MKYKAILLAVFSPSPTFKACKWEVALVASVKNYMIKLHSLEKI